MKSTSSEILNLFNSLSLYNGYRKAGNTTRVLKDTYAYLRKVPDQCASIIDESHITKSTIFCSHAINAKNWTYALSAWNLFTFCNGHGSENVCLNAAEESTRRLFEVYTKLASVTPEPDKDYAVLIGEVATYFLQLFNNYINNNSDEQNNLRVKQLLMDSNSKSPTNLRKLVRTLVFMLSVDFKELIKSYSEHVKFVGYHVLIAARSAGDTLSILNQIYQSRDPETMHEVYTSLSTHKFFFKVYQQLIRNFLHCADNVLQISMGEILWRVIRKTTLNSRDEKIISEAFQNGIDTFKKIPADEFDYKLSKCLVSWNQERNCFSILTRVKAKASLWWIENESNLLFILRSENLSINFNVFSIVIEESTKLDKNTNNMFQNDEDDFFLELPYWACTLSINNPKKPHIDIPEIWLSFVTKLWSTNLRKICVKQIHPLSIRIIFENLSIPISKLQKTLTINKTGTNDIKSSVLVKNDYDSLKEPQKKISSYENKPHDLLTRKTSRKMILSGISQLSTADVDTSLSEEIEFSDEFSRVSEENLRSKPETFEKYQNLSHECENNLFDQEQKPLSYFENYKIPFYTDVAEVNIITDTDNKEALREQKKSVQRFLSESTVDTVQPIIDIPMTQLESADTPCYFLSTLKTCDNPFTVNRILNSKIQSSSIDSSDSSNFNVVDISSSNNNYNDKKRNQASENVTKPKQVKQIEDFTDLSFSVQDLKQQKKQYQDIAYATESKPLETPEIDLLDTNFSINQPCKSLVVSLPNNVLMASKDTQLQLYMATLFSKVCLKKNILRERFQQKLYETQLQIDQDTNSLITLLINNQTKAQKGFKLQLETLDKEATNFNKSLLDSVRKCIQDCESAVNSLRELKSVSNEFQSLYNDHEQYWKNTVNEIKQLCNSYTSQKLPN